MSAQVQLPLLIVSVRTLEEFGRHIDAQLQALECKYQSAGRQPIGSCGDDRPPTPADARAGNQ